MHMSAGALHRTVQYAPSLNRMRGRILYKSQWRMASAICKQYSSSVCSRKNGGWLRRRCGLGIAHTYAHCDTMTDAHRPGNGTRTALRAMSSCLSVRVYKGNTCSAEGSQRPTRRNTATCATDHDERLIVRQLSGLLIAPLVAFTPITGQCTGIEIVA